MAQFCANCGNQLDESVAFCPKCGTARGGVQPQAPVYPQTPVYPQPVQPQVIYVEKKKIPGRGFGISGLVLGIIGLVYSFILFLEMLALLLADMGSYYGMSSAFNIALAVACCFYAIPSILALIFGTIAGNRGYRNGVQKGGYITGMIGVIFAILSILICIAGSLM